MSAARKPGRPKGGNVVDGAEVRRLYASDLKLTHRELARRFNCSVGAIQHHLRGGKNDG